MIVKEQKPIELVNNCKAIYDEQEVIEALLYFSGLIGKPIARLKTVYMYGKYPAVSIYHYKVHLHRLLGIYWWRDTEFEFDGQYIHHINHNKLDARKPNLRLINISEHQSQHNKGRIFTPEHRAKIGEANRTRWIKRFPQFYENPELINTA